MIKSVDVVEASAGSGKTFALAKRYLQLLMSPEIVSDEIPLKSILAVTFTNKATIEMKERIVEFLKKIALNSFADRKEKEAVTSILTIGEPAAKKNAFLTIEQIIKHYNFFQVETIDSFIKSLLSGCAFHLNLGPNFRIKENYRQYLEYSFDKLIDKAPTDTNIRRIFRNFLKSYLFIENKESWLVKKDIFSLMAALYNYTNIYGGAFGKISSQGTTLSRKKKAVIALSRKIHDFAPEETDRRFIKSLGLFLEKSRDGFNIDALSTFFNREEFPVRKNKNAPEKIVKWWDALHKNLAELCEIESRLTFKSYIEIYNRLLDDLRALLIQDEVILLSELNNRAQFLLDEGSITVPEVYYRLATRFRHYLIDEFQDTSRLQWKNLRPLIDEALSSGGTLFYVGDKKQAIYRFRGGDASLFNSVRDNFQDFKPELAILGTNFRSQKEIVEFNNQIFSRENLQRFLKELEQEPKNSLKVLEVFSDAGQKWIEENKYGYVEVESVKAGNAEETNSITRDKLLTLIKNLKENERFSYEDLALLVRTNKDVKLFTSWLMEEGIPVESDKTLNIREQPFIKELISFLKFLNSPIDNLSFASFVLGDIFLKASGIAPETMRTFLFNLRQRTKNEEGFYLYKEFKNSFPDKWGALLEEFFKNVGFVPLYELMISILGKFKVMENFSGYQGFFMKLLELIKEKEDDYSGLSSFLEFFETMEEKELYVHITNEALPVRQAGSAQGVKISTIHKAKGLEFPVVIIPFLEIDVSVGSGGINSRKPYVVKQLEDKSLELVQLKKRYGFFSKQLDNEYKEEYISSLIGELNNLYVAFTRSKYELYIFIPEKAGNKKNIARIFMPFETYQGGRQRCYEKLVAKEKRDLINLPISQYSDWCSVLKEEFIGPSKLLYRDKVIKGKLIHFILSCIGNLSREEKEASLKAAKEKAALSFTHIENLDECISLVRELTGNEKFKPFFYVEKGALYCEKEIVDKCGHTKRIDRLIISSGEAWIIDYKSSKDELGRDKKQISEYKGIIKSLYPKLKIKCFLIYLDILDIKEIKV